MYQTEHDELFASIRNGKPINNGEYMARSTLLAIMGRMAAYTGQEITWEMAMNSKEDLSPIRLRLGRPATRLLASPSRARHGSSVMGPASRLFGSSKLEELRCPLDLTRFPGELDRRRLARASPPRSGGRGRRL